MNLASNSTSSTEVSLKKKSYIAPKLTDLGSIETLVRASTTGIGVDSSIDHDATS